MHTGWATGVGPIIDGFFSTLNDNRRQRSEFAVNVLSLYKANADMLFFMMEKAHFNLDGFVNKQNCH